MYAAKLSIPKQNSSRKLTLVENPEHLQKWLDDLPIVDIEKSTTMVLELLSAANRTKINVSSRIHLLKKLSPLSDLFIKSLRAKYNHGASPYSSARNINRLETVKTLLHEMGYGFKLVITRLFTIIDSTVDDDLAYAIFNAMKANASRLIESYQLYEPIIDNVWGELSLLYNLAIDRNIHKNEFKLDDCTSNTEQAYMQLLLLEAINPYRLMHGEALRVYDLMGQWSHHAKLIQPGSAWVAKTPELVINLSSGSPPYMVSAGTRPDNLSELRIISINKVKEDLKADTEDKKSILDGKRTAAKELNFRLEQDMMKRLSDGWRSDIDRGNKRVNKNENLEIIAGIKDCYSLFYVEPTSITDTSLDDYGLVPIDNHWGNAVKKKVNTFDSVFKIDDPQRDIWADKNTKVGADDIKEKNKDKSQNIITYAAKQIDISSGGIGIEFDLTSNLHAKVGDLICIRRPVEGAPWRLGDVRWQRTHSNKQATIGLRLLSENPKTVICIALDGLGSGGGKQVGLLIHSEDITDETTELIVPAALYELGTLLEIELDNVKYQAQLIEKIETTSSFSCFKFKLR